MVVCRWFHYGCAPTSSSCIDVGSGCWFHCDGCSGLRGRLGHAALGSAEARAAAVGAAAAGDDKAGGTGASVSLVLLDLGEIRRARDGEGCEGTVPASKAPSAFFKPHPRFPQPLQHQQQQQLTDSVGGGLVGSSLAAVRDGSEGADADVVQRRRRERLLLCGAAAQRDLAAVARIFSRLVPRDPGDSALEEVGG